MDCNEQIHRCTDINGGLFFSCTIKLTFVVLDKMQQLSDGLSQNVSYVHISLRRILLLYI